MAFLYIILLYFLIGGSILYLLVCVDPNDKGILGKLSRLAFKIMPDFLKFTH